MKKHLFRAVALGLATLACPPVAFAASRCRVVDGTDPAVLTPAWRRAVESLQREVAASLDATCRGVDLVLTTEAEIVRITAKTPDGRETSRRVTSPEGLSAVAFGLLAAAPGEDAPPAEIAHDVVIPLRPSPPSNPPPLELPPQLPPEWTVSFSAATGIRAEFPSHVLLQDFEVRADSLVHDWLVTVHVRAAPLVLAMSGPYDVDSFEETAFGLGFGRQVRFGRAALALTGTADIAYVWIENDELVLSSERAQLRLAAVARLAYRVSRVARLNATLDGELSPTGLAKGSSDPGLPAYPAFTIGIRLGAEALL